MSDMSNDERLGLYIHFPFCRRKCVYCDFYSVEAYTAQMDEYTSEMLRDIRENAALLSGTRFNTLFIGGGTPSVGGERLCRIVSAALDCFSFDADAEITTEANPESLTRPLLDSMKLAGINRISIGAQSFCDSELKDLGRMHGSGRVYDVCHDICAAGFENFNIDIMFGVGHRNCKIPHEETFHKTLDALLDIAPPHISAYDLKIADKTPLSLHRSEYLFPDEDADERMYCTLCSRLAAADYGHYEISNFARQGFECRHNLKYWESGHYLGLGPASHSYIGSRRYGILPDLGRYLRGERITVTDEIIVPASHAYERLVTGLRLSKGVTFAELGGHFDIEAMKRALAPLCAAKLVMTDSIGFSLTERGFRLSNSVINLLSDYMIKQEKKNGLQNLF